MKIRPDDIIVVFNNKQPCEFEFSNCNYHPLIGTNKCLDMSAYYEGFLYANRNLEYSKTDIVVFLNDSILCKHPYKSLLNNFFKTVERYKMLPKFYCGIPSIVKNNEIKFKYLSTYFIVSNFYTINSFLNKIIGNYRFYRRKNKKFIQSIYKDSWRPQKEVGDLKSLLNKKKICVFFEMTLSEIASNGKFLVNYNDYMTIRGLRFLIKIKNFSKKVLNIH